ncbi:unnamed protein product [Lathyrus sativus]|nr:unnamed protein product [Lathyrus sativus]
MIDRFDCVINHGGVSDEFNRICYKGLKKIWQVDPDFWSYFKILGGLKNLGYPKVESLWYYHAMDDNELVMLQDDAGTNRMKTIAFINENVHLYVMHLVYEKEQILPLENNVGPNGVDDDILKDDMLNELNNCVKKTFDDLGTIEEFNNLGDKFDEGRPTDVEDSTAVDQEGSFKDVNVDETTEGLNQKELCQDVNFEGDTVSEDTIVNITLDGTTDHILCDQEDDILDGTYYMVSQVRKRAGGNKQKSRHRTLFIPKRGKRNDRRKPKRKEK